MSKSKIFTMAVMAMILVSNAVEIVVDGFHWLRGLAGGLAAAALLLEILEAVKHGKAADDE